MKKINFNLSILIAIMLFSTTVIAQSKIKKKNNRGAKKVYVNNNKARKGVVNKTKTNRRVVVVKPNRPHRLIKKPAFSRKGYIWVAGHWKWSHFYGKYIWVTARWKKIKKGHRWLPGYWQETPFGFFWIEGSWVL